MPATPAARSYFRKLGEEPRAEGSTGVIYWEGAVAAQGTSRGRKVSGEGYVELTGYAGSLGGIF